MNTQEEVLPRPGVAAEADPEVLNLSDPVEDELRAEGEAEAVVKGPPASAETVTAVPSAPAKKDKLVDKKKKTSKPLTKAATKSRLNSSPARHDFAALSGKPAPWTKRVSWTVELASALPSSDRRLPEAMDVDSAATKNISDVWDKAFARITTLKPDQQARVWSNYQKLIASAPVVPFNPPNQPESSPVPNASAAVTAATSSPQRRGLRERSVNVPAPKPTRVRTRAESRVTNTQGSLSSGVRIRKESSRSTAQKESSTKSARGSSAKVARKEKSSGGHSSGKKPSGRETSPKGTSGNHKVTAKAAVNREKSTKRSEKTSATSKLSQNPKVAAAQRKARAASIVRNRSLPNRPKKGSPEKKGEGERKKASHVPKPNSRSQNSGAVATVKVEPEEEEEGRASVHSRLGPSWFAKEIRLPLQGSVPQDELLRLNGSECTGLLRTRRRRPDKDETISSRPRSSRESVVLQVWMARWTLQGKDRLQVPWGSLEKERKVARLAAKKIPTWKHKRFSGLAWLKTSGFNCTIF